jgi:carotenoid cleavage dioxygenase
MLRRSLLKVPAITGLIGLLGRHSEALASAPTWLEPFQRALAERPWLQMVRSAPAAALESQARVAGRWPAALQGTLFRNGPAGFEVGGFRCHHWFDGDGMMQAYQVSARGVTHRARMIETHKYRAERVAGRPLFPGFGTSPADPYPVTSPDTTNTGNISVLAHGKRLLALWEAGSPWDIDPDTLQTRGAHVFSPDTAGAPFSAHPRLEPDGTVWNFGYASAAGRLVLWQLDADGRLVRTGLVPCDPMGMPHDFVVTQRHLVLLIPPFHYQPDGQTATFVQAHHWHPDRPTRVLVVEKGDFTRFRWLELPAQWVFHFGNGWEDGDGIIRFDAARSDDPSAMVEGFSRIMRGDAWAGSRNRHHRYRIDTQRGTIEESPMFDDGLESEFPVIDPRVSCRRNRRLVMLTRHAARAPVHPLLDTLTLYDDDTQTLSHYRYPHGVIPEEHLFVPAPGSQPETEGWIVGSALNYREGRTELHVFDAGAVDAGPVATAMLPYALPLSLHGKFVAS